MHTPSLQVHGVDVPRLGLGTWRLTGLQARQSVADALAQGYRHVDTAAMYGNEAEVGAGLKGSGVPRESVFLTTKVWRDDLAARALRRSADESLRRLRTDYVDLLLVHWPSDETELEATLDALQEVRHEEKARLIGVSNFPSAMLEDALALVPDLACNQVEYHPFLGQDAVLGTVRQHGLFLAAYRPLGGALVAESPVVQAIAAHHGAAPAQIALAWLLGQDRVAAVPKAASAAHRQANLDALGLVLTADERARLDALPKGHRYVSPDFAPRWDEASPLPLGDRGD